MDDNNETKQKFMTFKSSYSPVHFSINLGDACILEDWKRLNWESSLFKTGWMSIGANKVENLSMSEDVNMKP